MKNFRIDMKFLPRVTMLALLIVGLCQFVLSWFGPFALSLMGASVLVASLTGPAIVAGAVWVVGIFRPRWILNRGTFILVLAAVITNVVYTESALRVRLPVRNEPCLQGDFMDRYDDYNLVLISLDTLRADRLGAYGHENEASPWMDRLAAEGALFERCYSAAPATLISHATMFTGLNPGAHGAQCMTYEALPKSALTLTEILQMNGYRTGGFTGGAQISRNFGFSQGFDVYDHDGGGMKTILPKALEWLEAGDDENFFLFLHSFDIHHPYEPPPPFNKMFFPDYAGPLGESIPLKLINDINKGEKKVTVTDIRYISSVYDGGIRYTDQYIGKLYEYLEEKGLLEKTIIVLTSDHGEEFDEHGTVGTHAHSVYDELLHVPMILRLPGARPARVSQRVGLVDLVPTLLDLLGLGYPENQFQGVSFASMMGGEQLCAAPPRLMLAEKEYLPAQDWEHMKAVRSGDWKLKLHTDPLWKRNMIRAFGGFVYPVTGKELYDVKADPGEQHNKIMEHVKKARGLEALLYGITDWNAENALERDPESVRLDAGESRRLKDLGYVQ